MRVLILSQWYQPEPIPKPSELAQELQRRGHQVSVLTGLPNYPSGVLYAGYRLRLWQREEIDGIPVVRTFEWPYHDRASRGRILNYLSFMLSSIWGALLTPPCDVIYAWHPPLSTGIAAAIISWIKRAPFVYDVQDIWPEAIVLSGWNLSARMIKVMHWMERFIYRHARHIFVVTEGAKQNLLSKGVPAHQVSVASHWIDETAFVRANGAARDVRQLHQMGNSFVVMFAGNMGLMQGLDAIIAAAGQLRQHTQIKFVLIGDGVERARLVATAVELGLKNVMFIERQQPAAMPQFLSAADALLVPLRPSTLDDWIIPTKCLAYMAAGRPIIVAANGAAADLVRKAEAGLVTLPDDAERLAQTVLQLSEMSVCARDALGENGRAYALEHFSKTMVITQYEQVLLHVSRRPHER